MILPGRCISTNLEYHSLYYMILPTGNTNTKDRHCSQLLLDFIGRYTSFLVPTERPSTKMVHFLWEKNMLNEKIQIFFIEQSVECKTTWKLLCSQFQYLFHNPCPSWWNKIPENLKELEIKIRSENLEADVATCVFKFSCHSDNEKRHRNSGFILI